MSYEMTVCGNYIVSGVEFKASQTGLYHVDVVEQDDYLAAISFTQNLVRQEAQERGIFVPVTFFSSCVHPRFLDRCFGLDFADMVVDVELEMEKHSISSVFTVCGWYLDNGQTYSDYWVAQGPVLAYFEAWKHIRDTENRELMLSNVHFGELQRYSFPFVDPLCGTVEEMTGVMREFYAKK